MVQGSEDAHRFGLQRTTLLSVWKSQLILSGWIQVASFDYRSLCWRQLTFKNKYMWHLALPRSSHIDFILMDMPVVFSESSTTSLGYLLCLFWTHFHFIDFWSCGSKNWLECSQLDHSIFPPYPKTQFGNHNPNIANLKNMITFPRSALWEATWRNHEVPWNQHWGQKFGQRIWMVKGTPYCSHPSMATWIYLHERLIFVIVNW